MSQIEQAHAQMLIHRAEGRALNRLSEFYGFDRPLFIKDKQWAAALRRALFAARGTRGVISAFLEELFAEFTEYSTYTMTISGANSLQYQGQDIDMCNLENRYVNINGKRYYATHVVGNRIYLATTTTSYWGFDSLVGLVGTDVDVGVLPYIIEEYAGIFTLIIDAGVFAIPPTYLREDAENRDNEPYGGHIMDLFSDLPSERDNGPAAGDTPAYPAYLLLDVFLGRFFDIVQNVLAASIRFKVVTQQWCPSAPSIYGSLTDILRYGTVEPNQNPVQPARV